MLLAVTATACLASSGVAQAAEPKNTVTVGATTLSNIQLNGVPGTKLSVAPGEDVKISANWEDHNTACPDCFDNVAVAFAGNPVAGCIEEDGIFEQQNSGTGEVDLGPAPTKPGKYNVVALFEEAFECGTFWNASESTGYQVIAKVKVKPPKS